MVKAYKTYEDATKDLVAAESQLGHGGKQEVIIEHYQGGFVIAEFKIINGEHIFQRYYNGE